jgi:DNA-binding GntR family transcriptional regulator
MTPATEQHYTPAELAAMWGVSHHTIRRAFRDLEGVLRIRLGRRELVRIPASIAASWHERHSGRWDEIKGRGGRV